MTGQVRTRPRLLPGGHAATPPCVRSSIMPTASVSASPLPIALPSCTHRGDILVVVNVVARPGTNPAAGTTTLQILGKNGVWRTVNNANDLRAAGSFAGGGVGAAQGYTQIWMTSLRGGDTFYRLPTTGFNPGQIQGALAYSISSDENVTSLTDDNSLVAPLPAPPTPKTGTLIFNPGDLTVFAMVQIANSGGPNPNIPLITNGLTMVASGNVAGHGIGPDRAGYGVGIALNPFDGNWGAINQDWDGGAFYDSPIGVVSTLQAAP